MKNKIIIIILCLTTVLNLSAFCKNVAVLVGLNDYFYMPNLKYAEKDAEELEVILKRAGFETFLLKGENISGETILERINFIAKHSSYSDTLLFFFSGHGVEGSTEMEKGMLTAYSDPERRNAMVSHADLTDSLIKFKGKKIVVVDACYQGYDTKSQWVRTQNLIKAVDFLLLSSASNQQSHDGFNAEGVQINNGIAAYYLRKAIEGYGDSNKDKSLSAGELEEYLNNHAQYYAALNGQYMEVYNNRSGRDKLIVLRESIDQGEQKGTLFIESVPSGAEIWIGGKPYGQTPKSFPLAPGTYEVELRKSGCDTYQERIIVTSGSTARVEKRLEERQSAASLSVTSNPSGATIYLNGSYKGTSPKKIEDLEAGYYTIKLTKDGYEEKKASIIITEGKSETTYITLKPQSGGKSTYTPGRDVPDQVLVKAGTFQMGNTRRDGEGESDETVHTVKLTYDYYIGKYEVTFNEYDAYCHATTKSKPNDANGGRGNRPVVNVSWYDAIKYCNWLSEKEGLARAYDNSGNLLDKNGKKTTDITQVEGYRLPTEAEWEYAARGGHQSRSDYKYAGSNTINNVAWYYNNSSKTSEVGRKAPNELGIYDMSGNVWEWCYDWYDDYSSSMQTNPIGPDNAHYRVKRSGCWNRHIEYSRIANRRIFLPANSSSVLGLRIARTAN